MSAELEGIEIRTPRLTLRVYRPQDAPEIFAPITPELARWMNWEPQDTVEDLMDVFEVVAERARAGREVALVIRGAQDGEFLGMSGLHGLDTPEPETGVWIKPQAQRRGFGREAVAAVLDHAGRSLGLPALWYSVVEQNWPSRRIAEALGGTVVRRAVQHKPSGAANPMVVYRIPTTA